MFPTFLSLIPGDYYLKVEDDSHFKPTFEHPSRRPRPAVSQHNAIFSSDAIFSGESLLLDVNFGPKISRRPEISRRLTASGWVSEDNLSAAGASTCLAYGG